MRYYLDTEFIERGHEHPIELISIGVVAEDGRHFYAVCEDGWDESHASDWVRANVLPHIVGVPRQSRAAIRAGIEAFLSDDPKPEFWGYYADYDWVLFCQLFGRMIDLPEKLPRFCRDVKQFAVAVGNPRLPRQTGAAHNALGDARHTCEMHEFLLQTEAQRALVSIIDSGRHDGTDAAHPAWWRGHDDGARGVVKALTAMLDRGERGGTFSSPELDALATRIEELADACFEARRLVLELRPHVGMAKRADEAIARWHEEKGGPDAA